MEEWNFNVSQLTVTDICLHSYITDYIMESGYFWKQASKGAEQQGFFCRSAGAIGIQLFEGSPWSCL